MTSVLHSSKKQDWITPPWLCDLARDAMGGIDLDPLSSDVANLYVKADKYYTPAIDGTTQPWFGNVWMNPPYGGDTSDWVNSLIFEWCAGKLNQACLLVNAMTDCKWFHKLWKHADAICFLYKRVQFLHANGESGANPTHGSVVAYFGGRTVPFGDEFREHGHIVWL